MLETTRRATVRGDSGQATPTRPARARRDLLARLSVMSLATPGRREATPSPVTAEAGAVARAWLDLIHSGRSSSSWAVASPTLKEAVAPEEWQAALHAVRTALGRCRARTLESVSAFERFPGLPGGPYVVVRFQSVFEERPAVSETVTTSRGEDGHWRATAYFVG